MSHTNGKSGKEEYLRLAFQLAREAKELGDGAFGAIVIDESKKVIARAGNTTTSENSVTYHAEINAIQQAEYNRGKGKLKGCTLISSAEPCAMCAAAIVWSGLSRVIYGVSISAMQQAGIHQIDIESRKIFEKAEHDIEVHGPVMEEEGMEVFAK
ncbi:nucleoside deaminase [Balneola sp. MJW-20]|uniref:nucleoside deaminase n=1 Tax=Gracilimonas aurantiaca TaxID=3234185 RepID=UPI003466A39C